MTFAGPIDINQNNPSSGLPMGFTDRVMPWVIQQAGNGKKSALVTFVDKEGTAPRPIGAQMAVCADGRSIGHIASSCLGGAIISEALDVIKTNKARLIRYGKGSKYIDLKLPCGSGIDLYFSPTLSDELLNDMAGLEKQRSPKTACFNLTNGTIELIDFQKSHKPGFIDTATKQFIRPYLPQPRLFLFGNGLNVIYLAHFAQLSGFDVLLATSDPQQINPLLARQIKITNLQKGKQAIAQWADPFTASVVMFHDHDLEGPLLKPLLHSPCFYLGAMGSKQAHEIRLSHLQKQGFTLDELQRLKGQIGAIKNSKSPVQLAISVLGQLMKEAKQHQLII